MFRLKCDALFEDRHVVETCLLRFDLFPGRHGNDIIEEPVSQFIQSPAFYECAAVEVDPVVFLFIEPVVGRDLDRREPARQREFHALS